MFTQQQKSFFETFGYLHLPGLFSDSIAQITADFESIWTERGGGHAGKPHDGKKRSCLVQFIDRRERLSALLDDPRLHDIATALAGADFNYSGSDGNYYAGDTPWHSDAGNPGIQWIKFAFYLDPLRRESGALRVIPGSHRFGEGFADRVTAEMKNGSFGLGGADIPAVAVESNPGDLVLFDSNVKHAAFGGSGWRRMFTIVISQRFPAEREAELRESYLGNQRWHLMDRMIDTMDNPYGECLTRTAGPQRKRHLEQLNKLMAGGVLTKLSREVHEKQMAAVQK